MIGRRLTAALLLGALCLASAPALAAEEILDFKSEIAVSADGSMEVAETIRVRAEGNRIKRGIYRDFPTTYRDRAGNRVTVLFDLLSARRDGRSEPFHTEKLKNGVRVYLGSRDVLLSHGVHTYRITYRTDRQLGTFDDHDELYWNVTGNGWSFPIRSVSARVTPPSGVSPRDLQMAGYVGAQGSREKNVTWEVTDEDRVVFSSGRPLDPGEGLTIVLGWPKGYVSEPDRAQRAATFLSDNRGVLAGAVGLILLLAYYIWAWIRAGRDPEKGTVVPLFTPPDGLSPAATRYIMEMGFDNRAFASAVINLAVKGYLTIEEEEKGLGFSRTYVLRRTGEEPKTALSRGEEKLASRLFPGGSETLRLERENHSRISGAIKALKDLLEAEHQKANFYDNAGYFAGGLLVSVAVLIAVALTGSGAPGGPPLVFVILWLTPWTVVTFFLWSTRKFLMAVVFTFFLVMAAGAFAVTTSFFFVLAILLLAALNILFYRLLKAPTRLGRRVMDRIEGFRMYLATAEEHRLASLHPPDRTPELFEAYLPYALALEVDQEWSEKFAGVLYRAASEEGYSPSWYHGRHWDNMHTARFATGLGSSLSSAISSASTAPGSSSGFGGGGSSGGGGGGGGGGGW